jgi:predicted nucleic acid-binding protein
MSKQFVLDTSIAVSWCIGDEQTSKTEALLDELARGASAIVPALWLWEINNVLLIAEISDRVSASKRHQQVALLKKLPITVDENAHNQAWGDTTALARTHRISVYDASYLELALRKGIPLGSLDKKLRSAAQKAGSKCLP